MTSWRTGKQAPPPGAAPQICNLSRGSFAFGETAESCGFCASYHPTNFCSRRCAAQAKIARHFCQFSKLSKVVGPGRLENLKGFQPWVDIFPPANGICLRKNICISAAHEAILPIFQIVKIGRLCRLENPTGFQPFAGNDFTGGPAYLF